MNFLIIFRLFFCYQVVSSIINFRVRLFKNTLAGLLLIAGLGCGNQGEPAQNPEAKKLEMEEKMAAEQAALWATTVKTEEGKFTFGGPLRPEEKPLVGRWRGSVNNKESPGNWEIVRRPNHPIHFRVLGWVKPASPIILMACGRRWMGTIGLSIFWMKR